MRTVLEFVIIVVVALIMTVILKHFEMNDLLRTFIAVATALLAGRLFDFNFYKKNKG